MPPSDAKGFGFPARALWFYAMNEIMIFGLGYCGSAIARSAAPGWVVHSTGRKARWLSTTPCASTPPLQCQA
jgi:hypothetical protein